MQIAQKQLPQRVRCHIQSKGKLFLHLLRPTIFVAILSDQGPQLPSTPSLLRGPSVSTKDWTLHFPFHSVDPQRSSRGFCQKPNELQLLTKMSDTYVRS